MPCISSTWQMPELQPQHSWPQVKSACTTSVGHDQHTASSAQPCSCRGCRREGASPARRAARGRLAPGEFPLQGGRALFTPSATSGDEEDPPPRHLDDASAAADDGADTDTLLQVAGGQSETAGFER